MSKPDGQFAYLLAAFLLLMGAAGIVIGDAPSAGAGLVLALIHLALARGWLRW